MFRRREMRRPENGYEVLERIKEELSDLIRLERDAGPLEGRDLTMVLAPGRKTDPGPHFDWRLFRAATGLR